ncbi:MAG: pantothenate kinase [Clostridia bacterium]|nr:pantothenate kinase [Clostridia bacterium]
MKTVIGIDVGGSTTKIVGFRKEADGKNILVEPQFVRATDPVTSIYGAFGKFTMQNGLELSDISRIMMTGAGSSVVTKPIYNLNCVPVPEFTSVGLGGLYLSGLGEAIVVSMGTGTALIHAKNCGGKYKTDYLGGTGVGGGTMVGLAKKMLGVDQVDHIEQLCEGGDLGKVDLCIRDISTAQMYSGVDVNLTASNFGKLSDLANKHDIALGIVNMVAETIAMMAIFSARAHGLRDIVLTGNLTSLAPIREVFGGLEKNFGVRFIIPELSQFGTVIGAALCEEEALL